jgi:ubiquinone biosynthesis protein Coq4
MLAESSAETSGMFTAAERRAFEDLASAPQDRGAIEAAAALLKAEPMTDAPERLVLPAALAFAALAAPDAVTGVYDAAARGWLGRAVDAPAIAPFSRPPEPIPQALWSDFWALSDDAREGRVADAGAITVRTAALAGHTQDDFRARVAEAAYLWPGVAEAAARSFPGKLDVHALASCPAGSIGHALYRLIVDNKFDLEVLDRDALGLRDLPKPLDYLNVRILQTHDLWHILAGYETTALHEIAISAFQMAQFGHSYSAMFLSVVAAIGHQGERAGLPVLYETIFQAYAHGRETPPLMDIAWESHWHTPVPELRATHGVVPFVSPFPADLFEQLRGMRAA